MKRQYFIGLYLFSILVIIFIVVMVFIGSQETKWLVTAIGLALIAIGLGLSSFFIALHVDSSTGTMNSILERIEQTQKDIQTELKEQASSRSPVVASLQALSQYYLDYMAKQKEVSDEKS